LSILGLPRLEFHLFSGQQNDRNSDLITGSTGKDLLFGGNFFPARAQRARGPEAQLQSEAHNNRKQWQCQHCQHGAGCQARVMKIGSPNLFL
jgi:hypothetical protein